MIQVIQPPSSVFAKRCLFHTASVFVVIAVVTITVIVCLSNNVLKTGVKSEIDAQTYRITFDSLTEDIVENATKQVTQYHVTGPENEIWVLNDFKGGIHVVKIIDVMDDRATCYVTELNAVIEYFDEPSTDMRDDEAGSETERDINIQTVSLSFEADNVPVDDESLLGSPGLELCKGHTAFQMRRYEEPDADQSSKSLNDGNRLVIRSYTINHRRPGAYPNDELMQPASPVLNTIDASVSRVRRQVAPYDERQEMTTEVQILEESTRMSRVFRIWDYYFSRLRQRQHAAVDRQHSKERTRRFIEFEPETHRSQNERQREDALVVLSNFRMIDKHRRRRVRRQVDEEQGTQQQQQPRAGQRDRVASRNIRILGNFGRKNRG